jgi:hypothetical protein
MLVKFEPAIEYMLDEEAGISLLLMEGFYKNHIPYATIGGYNGQALFRHQFVIDDYIRRSEFSRQFQVACKYLCDLGLPEIDKGLLQLGDRLREALGGNETAKQPLVITTASDLLKKDFAEPRWAIEGLLQEGVTILAGAPKLGKSWMALSFGIAVSQGGYALGTILAEYGDVLYLALEDGPRRLQSRINKLCTASADLSKLYLATDWPTLDKGGLDAIGEWIDRHKSARLIVIDTLKMIRPPIRSNVNAYDSDYDFVSPLAKLGQQQSISILVVHHTRKPGPGEDPLNLISGSLGLSGAADSALVLQRQRGQSNANLFITGRDVDERELALKWDAEIASWRLLGDAQEQNKSEERRMIIDLIRSALQPLTPKGVASILGRKYETTKWLMWKMSREGQLEVDERGRYSIKPANPANPDTQIADRQEDTGFAGGFANDFQTQTHGLGVCVSNENTNPPANPSKSFMECDCGDPVCGVCGFAGDDEEF